MNPNDLQGYLQNLNVPDPVKADAWDHFYGAKNPSDFQARFSKLGLPDSAKADLWDLKYTKGFQLSQPNKPSPQAAPPQAQTPAPQSWWDQAKSLILPPKDQFGPGSGSDESGSPGELLIHGLSEGKQALAEKGGDLGAAAGEAIFKATPYTSSPTSVGIGKGTGRFLGSMAADPDTYALGSLGAEGKIGKTLMSAGFTGQMGYGSVEQAKQLGSIWDREDIPHEQKVEIGTGLVLNTVMAGMTGSHAVTTPFVKGTDPVLSSIPIEDRASVAAKVNEHLARKAAASAVPSPSPKKTLSVEPTSEAAPVVEQTKAIASEPVGSSDGLSVEKTPVPHEEELIPDRRKEPRGTDRRADIETRKKVSEMSPEERAKALLTSEKTGLPNLRAFNESEDTLSESHPIVGYADIDDFKALNTKLGHDAVDEKVLPTIGKVFQWAASQENGDVHVYHRSGDEFLFRGTDPDAVKNVVEKVNQKFQSRGVGFSYGWGNSTVDAELSAEVDKRSRKEAGLRIGDRDADTLSSANVQSTVPLANKALDTTQQDNGTIGGIARTKGPMSNQPVAPQAEGQPSPAPSAREQVIERAKARYSPEALAELKADRDAELEGRTLSTLVQYGKSKKALTTLEDQLALAKSAQSKGFSRGAKTPEEIAQLERKVELTRRQTTDLFAEHVKGLTDEETKTLVAGIEEPVYKQVGKALQLHTILTQDVEAKRLRSALNEDVSETGLSERTKQFLMKYFPSERIGNRLTRGEQGQRTKIYDKLGYQESENQAFKLLKFLPDLDKAKRIEAGLREKYNAEPDLTKRAELQKGLDKAADVRAKFEDIHNKVDAARKLAAGLSETETNPKDKAFFDRFNEKRTKDLVNEDGIVIARKGEYVYNPIVVHPKVKGTPVATLSKFVNVNLPGQVKEINTKNIRAILGKGEFTKFDRLKDHEKAALNDLAPAEMKDPKWYSSPEGRSYMALKHEFMRDRVREIRDTLVRRIQNNMKLVAAVKTARGIPADHLTPLEHSVAEMLQTFKEGKESTTSRPLTKNLLVAGAEKTPASNQVDKVVGTSETGGAPSAPGKSTDVFSQVQGLVDNLRKGAPVDPALLQKLKDAGAIKEGMGNGAIADTLQKYINRQRGVEKAKATRAGKAPIAPTPESRSPEVQKAMDMLSELPQDNIDALVKEAGLPKNAKLIDLAKKIAEPSAKPSTDKPSLLPQGTAAQEAVKPTLSPNEETAHRASKALEADILKLDPAPQTVFDKLRAAAGDIGKDRLDKYLLYKRGLEVYKAGLAKGDGWQMFDAAEAIRRPNERGTIGPSRRQLTDAEIKEGYRVYAHTILGRYEKMTDLGQARFREKFNDGVLERAVKESGDPNVQQRFATLRDKIGSTDPITRLGSAIIDGREVTAKTAAQGIMREALGEQKLDKIQLRKLLEQSSARWDKAHIADSVDFIDAIESGDLSKFGTEDQAIGSALRTLLDDRRSKLKNLGTGILDDYIENYFPHLWSNVGKARNLARDLMARKPLAGDAGFLRSREYDTFKEGLATGLQPVTWNPVKMGLLRLEQVDKFLAAHRMAENFKKEGLVQYVRLGGEVPSGWVEMKDRIFSATKQDPKTGALMTFGKWYAPADVAKSFNNHLSPGLSGNKAYDIIRTYGNGINQANLVGGVFHLVESGFNTTVSDLALSLQQAATKGQRLGAVKSVARMPVSIIDAYFNSGRKMMAETASPGTFSKYAKSVDYMAKAGGTLQLDPQYLNQSTEKFRTNLKIAMDSDMGLKRQLAAGVKLPLDVAGSILEKSNWFVMEHFVPRMKAATFHRMAMQIEDKLGPNTDPRVLRMELDKAWDSVDNRLGELIYDNLFWNRTAKDMSLVAFRSTGWNLGTAREIGGGALDLGYNVKDFLQNRVGKNPKRNIELSPRTAYTIALTGAVMGIGATMTYLATGHGPQSLADYFFPKDESGNRHYLKSYVHDIMGGLHDLPKSAVVTLAHKASPMWSQAYDIVWANADFYGREIRHPDDTPFNQVQSVGKYLVDSSKPFFYQNFKEEQRRDASTSSKVEALFGILPAPKWAGQSKAENLAYNLALRAMPQGPRDAETFDRIQRVDSLRAQFANGHTKIEDLLKAADSGEIRYKDVETIARESDLTPLQRHVSRLTAKDAMRVWQAADPGERQKLEPMMWKKFEKVYTDYGPEDQKVLEKQFSDALLKQNRP